MNVDYITEINGLDDWEFRNPLSATAYKVMRKLQYLAYLSEFPEKVRIANTRLCSMVGCTENSLIAARQQLIQRGLIDYKGGKKQTPAYAIRYFSLGLVENCDNCGFIGGYNRGIKGGYNRGIKGGYNRGISGGYAGGREEESERTMDEEDIYNNNISIPPGAHAMDYAHLYHPSSVEPSVDADARPRARSGVKYPPRVRRLSREETAMLARIDTVLDQPMVKQLFGSGMAVIREMERSDRFPLDLIGEAISRTMRRDSRYTEPLGSPLGYMQTLLEDWESEGHRSLRDLREARGDFADAN
ncbi:MAG: hypothetical protein IJ124_04455 [Clostridia bacterium]|nr:hypothetical protein [Clostridia bacterium]